MNVYRIYGDSVEIILSPEWKSPEGEEIKHSFDENSDVDLNKVYKPGSRQAHRQRQKRTRTGIFAFIG
jgi:hypothetical protein